MRTTEKSESTLLEHTTPISVLLNNLNLDFNYSKLNNIDNLYIPLKFFIDKNYTHILKILSDRFDIYIYMPTIIKGNYRNLFFTYAEKSVKKYNIQGFVVSNIGTINLLNSLFENYRLNIINLF